MSTKSTIGLHKNFDKKVKDFVGEEMYKKFIELKIGIGHIKKICLKIGAQKSEDFKSFFLKTCNSLILRLENLQASNQSYSKNKIKKIISDLFLNRSAA
jgi:hypothetical protein